MAEWGDTNGLFPSRPRPLMASLAYVSDVSERLILSLIRWEETSNSEFVSLSAHQAGLKDDRSDRP